MIRLTAGSFLKEFTQGDITAIDLATTDFEEFGIASSGAFGTVLSGETVATLLLSNLSDTSELIDLPGLFDGFNVPFVDPDHRTLDANSHRLLTFWFSDEDEWLLLGSGDIFGFDTARGGIGIGESLFKESLPADTRPSPHWGFSCTHSACNLVVRVGNCGNVRKAPLKRKK